MLSQIVYCHSWRWTTMLRGCHGDADHPAAARSMTIDETPRSTVTDRPRTTRDLSPLDFLKMVAVGICAGLAGGNALVGIMATVGLLAIRAAISDLRTLRIPNLIVLAVVGTTALGIPLVSVVDERSAG